MISEEDIEHALLGFDGKEIAPFLIGGKPAPNMLQALKRRGLCYRFRVPLRSHYRWELTNEGRQRLIEIRRKRGLPDYAPAHHRDDS